MIEYIQGEIDSLNPATAVVDCNGIGYEINITLPDYSKAESQKRVRFYIHEAIREDAHVLFGFLDRGDRELFRLLIGVSGVGPGTARLILSALPAETLESAIASGNVAALKNVKGIGAKTAQRIIVDLKDKINSTSVSLEQSQGATSEAFEETLAALVTLGYSAPQSRKALEKLFANSPALNTQEALRQALKLM